MLEVIARSLDNFTKQRRRDLHLHRDDLRANEFDIAADDSEATDSANERAS